VASDLDRLAGQHKARGFEPDFLLRGADLGLDDFDREILPAHQARDAIPAACRSFVCVHRGHTLPDARWQRPMSTKSDSAWDDQRSQLGS